MTLSIIIPCYNQAQYLPDAIQSALDQTLPCEIIVINDGSTDTTLEVAKRFPVKVIDQNNKGLPSARNTGLMHATGDYMLPLDADDMLRDDAAELLLKTAQETDADVVAPSMKCFGVANNTITVMPTPTLEDFKSANRIPYACAIKTSTLKEVGGYSPRMYWGYEDYALWIDLLKRGKKFVNLPEPLLLYRTKENSMLTEALKHHDELIGQIVKDNPSVYA